MAGDAIWIGSDLPTPLAVIEAWTEAGGRRLHEITALELTSTREESTTVDLTMRLSPGQSTPSLDDIWVRCTGVSGLKLDQTFQEIYSGRLDIEDLQSRGWDGDKVFRISDPEQEDGISFYARTLEWCVGARPAP